MNFLRSACFAALLGIAFTPSAFAQKGPAAPEPAAEQPAPDQQQEEAPQNFGPRVKGAEAGPSPIEQPEGSPPPTETIGTFGAWQVQCSAIPAENGQPADKQCGMVQITQSEKNKEVGLSLIMVQTKNEGKTNTMMRVMVPTGVYLPTGVALEIDGAPVGRVPFTRCLPQICEAFAEASPETLAKMKKGTAATFIIYEAPGIGIPMKIALKGFGQGMDMLTKQ